MTSEFCKGQLVAVRDADVQEWKLRVYDHASPNGKLHYCYAVGPGSGLSIRWWRDVQPAEEIWPELFFDRDSDNLTHMRRMRRDLGVKLRQIDWLCLQLKDIGDRNGVQECPPDGLGDCRIGDCARCWEQASKKAVEECGDD